MSHSLRLPAVVPGAVMISLLLFAMGAAATTRPEPVAPVPADAIAAADVKKLQDTIKGLHDRFEDQGKILLKNSDDLGTLTKRVDDYLKPSTLDPVKTGLAAVVNKINDLQVAVGRLAEAQEKQTADTATQFRDVMAALARLQEQLAKSDAATDASIVRLRQAVAASYASATSSPKPADNTASLLPLLGTIVAATLVLAVIILLNGRTQRRAQRTAQEQLAAALTQTRDSLLTEIQTRAPAASSVNAGAPAGADSLAEIRAKLQSVLEHLNPTVPAVHSDDHTTKIFPPTPLDERITVHHPVPTGAGIPSTACWPAAFFDPASPLSPWRERIESHLASREHPSLPVFSAFLALRTLCARQPAPLPGEVGAAVITLSQALYAYWDSLPDLSDDERARASSDWIQAVKALISSAAPKLEIREIVVGTRFDSDSMQTVQEGPGNHLNVAAVFSWATLDRSGERVKILQRARIATS